jgi:hypothetical protein
MRKAKAIHLRVRVKGIGVVNFDHNNQKYMYYGNKIFNFFSKENNVSYAKKVFFRGEDENGKLIVKNYLLKISSHCLKHAIFETDIPYQSSNIVHDKNIFYQHLGSPAAILRGYLFTIRNGSAFKRKSPITLSDAIQTCDALSTIEVRSKSGDKKTENNRDVNDDTKDNTFFFEESVGHIKYESEGFIDLSQLQFVSADDLFDRLGVDPDMFGLFSKYLGLQMPNFKSELGYYNMRGSTNGIPELGFKFSDENVLFLVKEFIKRLYSMDIRRKGSYANIDSLEYKVVYDPIIDTYTSEDGWIKINSGSDIESINFGVDELYVQADATDATQLRARLEVEKSDKAKINAEIKQKNLEEKRKNKKSNEVNHD